MRCSKKLIALIMCLLLLFLTGCSRKNTVQKEGETVTLRFLMYGVGEMRDSEEVWALFNEKLTGYIPGTHVEFEVINPDEYAERWKRMMAAKETVDVAWIGFHHDVSTEVRQGNLLPLDEYYKYVPDLTAELPEWIFDLGEYDGKSYLVPNTQMMTIIPYGARTHAELAQKYNLDTQKITETFNKDGIITREDFKPFEDYLEALKKAGELRKGVSKSFVSTIASKIGHLGEKKENIVANTCIDWTSDDLKVYDRLEDFPQTAEFYDMTRDWYEKGYIRKDVLSVTRSAEDEGKEDGYVLWAVSHFMNKDSQMSKEYGFEVLSFPVYQNIYISHSSPTTNLAVPSTAADPVRSVKLIELLNTRKGVELYNLLVYGIEGRHYTKVNDTEIIWKEPYVPGSSLQNGYGYYPWSVGNSFNAYETQYDVKGWNKFIEEEVNAKATKSPLLGFKLDPAPIELELAQYAAIDAEYASVEYGAYPNYRELLEERKARLKAAGSDKILREVQRQIDEWKKNK